jgi:hypothetical protein
MLKKLPNLSKTSWLFLSIGIFAVIASSLGLTYSKQLDEQAQLQGELEIAEKRVTNLQLQGLQQKQEEIQQQLDESILTLAAAQEKMHEPVASVNVTEEFYEIAYSCDVVVYNFSSTIISDAELGGIGCSLITLSATVTGELADIINFVIKLNSDLTTGLVDSTQLTITTDAEEASVGEEEEEDMDEDEEPIFETTDEDETTANLGISIYAYEGD